MSLPRKTDFRRVAMALCAVFGLLLSGGCASYQLGSMLPPEIQKVYIPTFVNQTSEPFIESAATRATIAEFQKDGSLDVVKNAEEADAILTVTLTGYALTPLVYDQDRKTAANEYRLTLTAKLLLTSAKTGKVVVENPAVQGEGLFDVIGEFTTSKAQALPTVTADLAHDLVEAVVEAW